MKVYELLNKKDKWIRFKSAQTKEGNICSPLDPKAYSFCVLGALEICYLDYEMRKSKQEKIRSHIKQKRIEPYKLLPKSIVTWNDTSTYKEIITTCKKLDI